MTLPKPALLLGATAVALAAFTLIGLGPRLGAATDQPSASAAAAAGAPLAPGELLQLSAATAVAAPAETTLTLPGLLLPAQQTVIHPQASGFLRRYGVDLGDTVRAGQVLAEIDTPALDENLRAAAARLAQAEAQAALAETTHARSRALLQEGLISQQQADAEATAAQAAAADVGVARASLRALQAQVGYQQVKAPFAGRITERRAEVGQLVDATAPLFTLADTRELRVTVQVPQSNMRGVAVGANAAVSLREYPGEVFTGRISRTAGALDAARTLTTEVRLPNAEGRLLAGAAVEVSLTLPNVAPAVLIPANALLVSGQGTQVVRLVNGQVQLAAVRVGRDLGKQVEILEGLNAGDQVALSPPDTLRDGQKVAVVEATAASAPKGAGKG